MIGNDAAVRRICLRISAALDVVNCGGNAEVDWYQFARVS